MSVRFYGFLLAASVSLYFAASAPAKAGSCWEEASWSQWKVGCEAIRKLASGKYLLLCCN
jgi:hypothetical protein